MSHVDEQGDKATLVARGRFRTLDPARPFAEAVVVRDGVIAAVGDWADVRDEAGDLPVHEPAGVAVPGFIDSHLHVLEVGREHARLVIGAVVGVDEIVDAVAAWIRDHPDAEWVVASAHFQVEDLREGRLPDRHDLDRVSRGRPVYLDRRTHDAIVNTEALRRAGVGRWTVDPAGGTVVRDADGEPTGVLVERPAADLVFAHVPPPTAADLRTAIVLAQRQLHGMGIVGAADPGVTPDQLAAYRQLHAEGRLTLRTMAMPLAESDGPVEEFLAGLAAFGGPTGAGDERLKVGPVKVYLDGTGSFGTAMTKDPWPGRDGYFGTQVCPPEFFRALVDRCLDHGWSLAVHTVGPGAVAYALDAFARSRWPERVRDLRFSLMHAYMWPDPEDIATASRLGVVLSAQPALHWRVGSIMRERFGAAGTRRFAPLRDWIDRGVPVAGGSDGPDFPIPPLFGMWQARTRIVNGLAGPMGTEHALTPAEALALYTTTAAAYCYAEAVRGSLAVGKLADWVELSADPVSAPDDELRDVAVERTVVGGAVVHERM